MKYSSTLKPSRKFERIGRSMISPVGLAIRPRMPASWRICWAEPRAPESAIMKIELKLDTSTFLPARSSTESVASCDIMSSEMRSVTSAQRSTTLL